MFGGCEHFLGSVFPFILVVFAVYLYLLYFLFWGCGCWLLVVGFVLRGFLLFDSWFGFGFVLVGLLIYLVSCVLILFVGFWVFLDVGVFVFVLFGVCFVFGVWLLCVFIFGGVFRFVVYVVSRVDWLLWWFGDSSLVPVGFVVWVVCGCQAFVGWCVVMRLLVGLLAVTSPGCFGFVCWVRSVRSVRFNLFLFCCVLVYVYVAVFILFWCGCVLVLCVCVLVVRCCFLCHLVSRVSAVCFAFVCVV